MHTPSMTVHVYTCPSMQLPVALEGGLFYGHALLSNPVPVESHMHARRHTLHTHARTHARTHTHKQGNRKIDKLKICVCAFVGL